MSYCFRNDSSDLCPKKSYYFKNSIMSSSLWEAENDAVMIQETPKESRGTFESSLSFKQYSQAIFLLQSALVQ